jgi:hypothetical protein
MRFSVSNVEGNVLLDDALESRLLERDRVAADLKWGDAVASRGVGGDRGGGIGRNFGGRHRNPRNP